MTTRKSFYPQTPLPDFAENDLYPAGSDLWSAAPTKLAMVEAVRDAGVVPDDQMGAQQYNWLNHRYGRLLRVLAHVPLQNWHAFTILEEGDNVGPGGYSVGVNTNRGRHTIPLHTHIGSGSALAPDFAPQQQLLAAFDIDNAGTLSQSFSANGLHWTNQTFVGLFDIDSLTDVICPRGTADNVILLGQSLSYFAQRSTNRGVTYATVLVGNPAGSPVQHITVFHQAANGRIFAGIAGGDTGDDRIAVSDDQGATWTHKALGSSLYTIVSMTSDGGDNTNAVIVATCNRDPFNTQPAVIRSTDNGETWNLVLELPAGPGSNDFVGYLSYSPVWQQFMLFIPGRGTVLISADGASWITRAGLPATGTGQQITHAVTSHRIQCIGSVFAFFSNMFAVSPGFDQVPGVFYTLDCGASWHFVGFGVLAFGGDSKLLTNIQVWGGRFLVSSRGVIYYSDPIWCPDPDLLTA